MKPVYKIIYRHIFKFVPFFILLLFVFPCMSQDAPEIMIQNGHSSDVNSVSISPDGKMIASGSSDKTVKLWDIETGKLLKTLKGHSAWINSVSFSPTLKTIASAGYDQTVKLWDIETGRLLKTFK